MDYKVRNWLQTTYFVLFKENSFHNKYVHWKLYYIIFLTDCVFKMVIGLTTFVEMVLACYRKQIFEECMF